MSTVSLVTSVPDLQVARICAAAGVPGIAMVQTHPDLMEISNWLEGTELYAQIIDPELPIPPTDRLIIPYVWYHSFSFVDKKCIWITDDITIYLPDGMLYTSPPGETDRNGEETKIFPFDHESHQILTWLDYETDFDLWERLFL